MKVPGAAQTALNAVLPGCSLAWFLAGFVGVGAIVGGVLSILGAFGKSTENNSKKMEAVCKQNDAYRSSAKQCGGVLEELADKEVLNAEQKNFQKTPGTSFKDAPTDSIQGK